MLLKSVLLEEQNGHVLSYAVVSTHSCDLTVIGQ